VDQVEVKRWVIQHRFHPANGWHVTTHIDPSEKQFASWPGCQQWFTQNGVAMSAHTVFGPADIVAVLGQQTYIVEVEGDTSKQQSDALYDALGQLLVVMHGPPVGRVYALAFPDSPQWQHQLEKLSGWLRQTLSLERWLVSVSGVRVL
jgi:hypothetical protein